MKAKLLGALLTLCLVVLVGCDDDDPVIGSGDATLSLLDTLVVAEEGQMMSFRVGLDRTVNRVVGFEFAVTGLTADSGNDFVVTVVEDSLLPFVKEKTIEILAVDDDDLEPGDEEEFMISITSVTNAQQGTVSSAVGKIVDNDAIFFTTDIQPMLLRLQCGNRFCHGSLVKRGNIFIGDSTYYAQNPGVSMYDTLLAQTGDNGQLIVLNNADSSTLYQSVLTSPSYGGSRMTGPGGVPLTDSEITRLRNWINQGAPLEP